MFFQTMITSRIRDVRPLAFGLVVSKVGSMHCGHLHFQCFVALDRGRSTNADDPPYSSLIVGEYDEGGEARRETGTD